MRYIGELDDDVEAISKGKRLLIYGCGYGTYGEKIYRNLKRWHKEKDIVAFVDASPQKIGKIYHDILVISVEEAIEKHAEFIMLVGSEISVDGKRETLLKKMENLHHIIFNINCERLGTEYGGFYVPKDCIHANDIIYSFGIGEDLSFSQRIVDRGGIVYAFDPTPKAIRYVMENQLFSNPRFHFMPYGLSDKNGKEDFYLPTRKDWVSASVIKHQNVDKENVIQVEMRTMRTIMEELGHEKIQLLKMDIEGSEFKVVDDIMNPLLKRVNCELICMETHERFFESKKCADNLYNTMLRNGFYDIYGTSAEPTFVRK